MKPMEIAEEARKYAEEKMSGIIDLVGNKLTYEPKLILKLAKIVMLQHEALLWISENPQDGAKIAMPFLTGEVEIS